MKKSNFVALILSVLATLCFGLGMCMCMLVEWQMFQQGIVLGCMGLILFVVMVIVYRKMEHMPPIHFTAKYIFSFLLGIVGVLGLGIGMCLIMVFNHFILGIIIGIVGILLLLGLIPVCLGIK